MGECWVQEAGGGVVNLGVYEDCEGLGGILCMLTCVMRRQIFAVKLLSLARSSGLRRGERKGELPSWSCGFQAVPPDRQMTTRLAGETRSHCLLPSGASHSRAVTVVDLGMLDSDERGTAMSCT